MNHRIMENGNLKITVDAAERAALRELQAEDPDGYGRNQVMYYLFEPLLCNSELSWCDPEEIGALTDAPILCTRDENDNPTEAWGFMDYQLRSPQDDLLETGRAVFQHG